MQRSIMKFSSIAASSVIFLAACSDKSPVAPTPPAPEAFRSLILPQAQQVNVVRRNTPLEASIKRSASIGILGGVISIPEAGLLVIVPPGAVLSHTTFTVTAPAGYAVAYEFGPHGARFLAPLIVEQDLRNTEAYGNLKILGSLEAGYFTDLNSVGITGLISEVLPVLYNPITAKARFTVGHFSGYLVTAGRTAEESAED